MSIKSLVNTFAGGGGRGGNDFFKAEDGKTYTLRPYRFYAVDEKGQPQKELCALRSIHFHGRGKPPTDCPGESCEQCSKAALLEAAGTKESLKQANDMRVTINATFVVIDTANPLRPLLMAGGWGLVRQVLAAIASAGGWYSTYPDQAAKTDPPEKQKEVEVKMAEFEAALERGIPLVCGPNGKDLVYTYQANKGQISDPDLIYPGQVFKLPSGTTTQ